MIHISIYYVKYDLQWNTIYNWESNWIIGYNRPIIYILYPYGSSRTFLGGVRIRRVYVHHTCPICISYLHTVYRYIYIERYI